MGFSDDFSDGDLAPWDMNNSSAWADTGSVLEKQNSTNGDIVWHGNSPAYGAWEFDHEHGPVYYGANTHFLALDINTGSRHPNDCYFVHFSNKNNSFNRTLRKTVSGTEYELANLGNYDSNWHSYRVERGPDDTFTCYIDGSQVATVTDSSHTTSGYFQCQGDRYDHRWDNVTVQSKAPAAPSNVTATVDTNDRVTVSWTDNSDNEDNFRVQVSRDGASYVDLANNPTPGANTTSITATPESDNSYDSQVGIDSSFKFRVRAENDSGTSDWAYSDTTYTEPVPPSQVSVSRPDGDTIEVTATVESDWASRLDWEHREDTGSGYGSWSNFETTGGHTKGDTVTRTYTVSNGDIQRDARYQVRVASYEYRDADNDGNNELLESEFVHADYGNEGNVYFSDDFESGDLSNWDSTGTGNGSNGPTVQGSSHTDLGIGGPAEGSYYCYIDDSEHITKQLGDLSAESDVIVKAYVASGSLDSSSEYNYLEWYDGSSWQNLRSWGHEYNKQGWIEISALVPSSYLSSDNRVRFTQFDNAYGGDHMAVDRVVVSDVLHEYTTPASPTTASINTSVEDEITYDYDDTDTFSNYGNQADIKRSSSSTWTRDDGGNAAEPYTYTGLDDGEEYDLRIRQWTSQSRHGTVQQYFHGYSPVETATTFLPAPTGLSVDAVNGDQATVSWTVNHDYGDQRVEVKPTDTSTWTDDSGTLSRSTTSYTTSHLLDGEKYDLRVLAATEHTTTEDA